MSLRCVGPEQSSILRFPASAVTTDAPKRRLAPGAERCDRSVEKAGAKGQPCTALRSQATALCLNATSNLRPDYLSRRSLIGGVMIFSWNPGSFRLADPVRTVSQSLRVERTGLLQAASQPELEFVQTPPD